MSVACIEASVLLHQMRMPYRLHRKGGEEHACMHGSVLNESGGLATYELSKGAIICSS